MQIWESAQIREFLHTLIMKIKKRFIENAVAVGNGILNGDWILGKGALLTRNPRWKNI